MKTKSLILSVLFLLIATGGLFAQDKYEFTVVQLVAGTTIIMTSNNVETFKAAKKDATAVSEGLKKVEELTSAGWEVYSSTVTDLQGIVYFLRKKKN